MPPWEPSEYVVQASHHIYQLYQGQHRAALQDAEGDLEIAKQLYELTQGEKYDRNQPGATKRLTTEFLRQAREVSREHPDADRAKQARAEALVEEMDLGELFTRSTPEELTNLLGPVPPPGGDPVWNHRNRALMTQRERWKAAAGAVMALRVGGGIDLTGGLPGRTRQPGKGVEVEWGGDWERDSHVRKVIELVESVQLGQAHEPGHQGLE